ncbi:MAG TPA: septum formation initiator family protein [Candidatus Acidoferrum sp.]|nr:septum formation initiator family protein [Candidatus Acidoferrum sp.]
MNRKKEPPSFFRRNLRTILGLAILAMAIHDVFGPHGFIAMRRTQSEITLLTAQIHQLNVENQTLSDEVNALQSDPRLIERIAREDMGLAKPGEFIFKMPDASDDSSASVRAKKKP